MVNVRSRSSSLVFLASASPERLCRPQENFFVNIKFIPGPPDWQGFYFLFFTRPICVSFIGRRSLSTPVSFLF